MKTKTFVYRAIVMLVLAAVFAALPAVAQNAVADPATAALIKRVADLEKSLAELKAELVGRTATTSAPVAAPVLPESVAAQAAAASVPQAADEGHTLGPLQFRGYTDFGFGRPLFEKLPPGGVPGSTQSFTVGDFDLFVNAPIGEHLSVLGEVLVTSDFSNSFGAEIDRLMLTYRANDFFSVSLGKYNTAIGYYTNHFHRARFFQTATSRPILFSDEDNGGVLPVHSIGMSATGAIPSGSLGLHWVAEVANGRSSRDSEVPVQNFVDENNGKALNFALYARPQWIHGLQTGVSYYRDTIHPPSEDAIQQRIYSAHIALVRPHLELLAEGVLLQHRPTAGKSLYANSSYAQASYKFGSIRPYFRYEYQNVASGDPVWGSLGRMNGPSAGVKFDLNDFSCFKIQYGRLGVRSGNANNDIQAQIALVF